MKSPPKTLKSAGRRLWRSVVDDYELETHEELLLEHACRTVDVLDTLDAAVGDELTADGKLRPEVIEARQQRIVLARLLAALRVPLGEETSAHAAPRLQRRSGVRGTYGPRGVVA